jgi:circadian clock protein KaiB
MAGDAKKKAKGAKARRAETSGSKHNDVWKLRLYVAGQTPKSIKALANIRALVAAHLSRKYTIEVIDLLERPHLASGDQILAIPTLVRRLPPPLRRIIGDLSNTERVLVGLDLKPRE